MSASEHRPPHLVSLGRAVRQTRERRHVTVAALAAASDIHEKRIEALEVGLVNPTYGQLLALADGLDMQLSELLLLAERLEKSFGQA